jgi:hypothetical protein
MAAAAPCPGYKVFRLHYEVALRRWGDVLLAQHAGRLCGDVERVMEIRNEAADERDAADKRMEDHKLSCPVCKGAVHQLQIYRKKIYNTHS